MTDQPRRRAQTITLICCIALAVGLFVVLYICTHSNSPHRCATPCDCIQVVDRPCR